MIPIEKEFVPKSIVKALDVQKNTNGGKWLKNNQAEYFPNGRSNDHQNKMVVYHELKSGHYAIKEIKLVD